MKSTQGTIQHFLDYGWAVFDRDAGLGEWVQHAISASRAAVTAPENERWLRHGRTWFVGVNALDNDDRGRLQGGPPLTGPFQRVIDTLIPPSQYRWDRAQVSVCYPGYPKFSGDEPESAHRYRVRRDAAHIDGLNRVGPERRRFLLEHHAFILGIPMVRFSPDASPFVVWNGSHRVATETFEGFYSEFPASQWKDKDVTATYQRLRERIFERCERVTIHANPGECFIAHRHSLHGVAPWGEAAVAGEDGRMICYFRPALEHPKQWLTLP